MGEVEMWLMLLVYIQYVVRKHRSSNVIENQIIPLLERFNFPRDCADLRALAGIVDTLKAEGFVLPLSTREALCGQLLRRALTANSVGDAKELVDYAKCIVDFSFYALDRAFQNAKLQVDAHADTLYVVEEQICWSIFEQDRLLQYMLEKEDMANSKLAVYLGNGLQSQDCKTRLLAIKLACTCSFNSRTIFWRLIPIFETALYYEDFSTREYVLAAVMDLIFVHHVAIDLQAVFHFIFPFLYAPTATLQLTAVIGCGRLLLMDCFPDEMEGLLSIMLSRYVHDFPDYCSLKGKLQQVDQALHIFFREYCGDKKLHQDEIANTVVYMCLQKIEEGIIRVDSAGKSIEDSPRKAKEARALHLAVNFGLSLCSNALDAVVDSLILNINVELGVLTLDKIHCLQWFLSN